MWGEPLELFASKEEGSWWGRFPGQASVCVPTWAVFRRFGAGTVGRSPSGTSRRGAGLPSTSTPTTANDGRSWKSLRSIRFWLGGMLPGSTESWKGKGAKYPRPGCPAENCRCRPNIELFPGSGALRPKTGKRCSGSSWESLVLYPRDAWPRRRGRPGARRACRRGRTPSPAGPTSRSCGRCPSRSARSTGRSAWRRSR